MTLHIHSQFGVVQGRDLEGVSQQQPLSTIGSNDNIYGSILSVPTIRRVVLTYSGCVAEQRGARSVPTEGDWLAQVASRGSVAANTLHGTTVIVVNQYDMILYNNQQLAIKQGKVLLSAQLAISLRRGGTTRSADQPEGSSAIYKVVQSNYNLTSYYSIAYYHSTTALAVTSQLLMCIIYHIIFSCQKIIDYSSQLVI